MLVRQTKQLTGGDYADKIPVGRHTLRQMPVVDQHGNDGYAVHRFQLRDLLLNFRNNPFANIPTLLFVI